MTFVDVLRKYRFCVSFSLKLHIF